MIQNPQLHVGNIWKPYPTQKLQATSNIKLNVSLRLELGDTTKLAILMEKNRIPCSSLTGGTSSIFVDHFPKASSFFFHIYLNMPEGSRG